MSDLEEGLAGTSGGLGRFSLVQPGRDPQSNWEVDLAQSLEDYLLKICSGQVSHGEIPFVNFAEAALLLQGSVQVYSRKVEYLYSLVLHALDFISQKRHDERDDSSVHTGKNERSKVQDEEDEVFFGLDNIPVDPKHTLDSEMDVNVQRNIVCPPTNLLVLEGDCLDSSGDLGELESYLLASCNCYGDFLLLDPSDASAVYEYMQAQKVGKEDVLLQRHTLGSSRSRHSGFVSPIGRSTRRSSLGMNQQQNSAQPAGESMEYEVNENSRWSIPPVNHERSVPDICQNDESMMNCEVGGFCSDDDEEDPWKPLNPHEPGNMKVKPFRKVRAFTRHAFGTSKLTIPSQIPLAKLDSLVNPDFEKLLEAKPCLRGMHGLPESPSLYEKLRRSFDEAGVEGNRKILESFEDEYDYNIGDAYNPQDATEKDDTLFDSYDMNVNFPRKEDGQTNFDWADDMQHDNVDSCESLEDLCRLHLDALLASISEAEKQTELDLRVSTWKDRIEHSLEEQDSHSPFDIASYGERILERLSLQEKRDESPSFKDVVIGQPKYEVARTFSALLQLVNDRKVDITQKRSDKLTCHTPAAPFTIKLLLHDHDGIASRFRRKRDKSLAEGNPRSLSSGADSSNVGRNDKASARRGRKNPARCTPDGKRRRRSVQLLGPSNVQSGG